MPMLARSALRYRTNNMHLQLHKLRLSRSRAIFMTGVFVLSMVVTIFQPFTTLKASALNDAGRAVLPKQTKKFGDVLKYNPQSSVYEYNAGYKTSGIQDVADGQPRFNASFHLDPTKGVTVTDSVNNLDFVTVPQFRLGNAIKDGNQIVYPLRDQPGSLVYTAQVASVKENILLSRFSGDQLKYDFDLSLPEGTEARLEKNGSIGVYGGDSPISGTVSTGNEKDRLLLQKARQHIVKTKLLFSIPAPLTIESYKKVSQVQAHYELKAGEHLSLVANHLKGASYPLSIDPSVYISTADKLMRGNNETNTDFDTSNDLIEKGKLSGGRFDNWLGGLSFPVNLYNMGTVAAGGYAYSVGGMSANTRIASLYWAKFSPATNVLTAPNPGSGACASWCTNSVYDLPVATSAEAVVSYNGYLYVFGGETNSGRSNTVYIAKLGANGEPNLWHPTDPNKANWVYWYTASSLSTERSYFGAAAYNNRMYITGGRTNAAAGGVSTIEEADISPIGTLSAFTTTGMLALPTVRHSFNLQIYNDRMYIIGGNSSGVIQSSVQFSKINNDGTMSGPWVTTTAMLKTRFSNGGNFSTISNGYLYVAGGCTDIIGSGDWCSIAGLSNARDIELASINADGSVTTWTAITGITYSRTGYGLLSWRQTLYGIGGCTAPNETTGLCTTESSITNYGAINADGDVSTTNNSVASGTTPCSGAIPTNCDIPPAGDLPGQGGRMASGIALNNGYIYIIGGCTVVTLTANCYNGNKGAMSGNISYASLAVDGTITQASNCVALGNTLYGTWCNDSTNRINSTTGVGGMATSVFNNTIYVVGGTDGGSWSANVWRVGLNSDGSLGGAWTAQAFNTMNLGIARGFAYTYARSNPSSAGTDPGVLYVLGGCNNGIKSNGIPCTTYYNGVYKCFITTTGAIDTTNQCTTTGQLQLDSENTGAGLGLASMAGTVYANYMYLIGGTSPNQTTRGTVIYAKIDNNNNIVAASGTTWITSPNQISPARLRNAAFGYNGYLYSLAGYSGSASLNDVLYAKINVNDGSISTFTTSNVTVNPRWGLAAVVGNGFVYALGGCSAGAAPTSCTTMTGAVQTFQLYNNYSGTPAGYGTINNLGVDRIGGSSVVLNGYIYYAGGCSDMACTAPTSTVYYATLGADGSVGTFTSAPNALPAVRTWGKLVASGGTLYYLGGQDAAAAAQSTVYYSTPASGVPAAWSTATNALPTARSEIGATVWDSQIYVTGGVSGGTRQNSVYVSPSLVSGGNIGVAWATSTGFNVARSGQTSFSYANTLYVIGGSDGTNYLNDVQFIKINSDGTLSSNGWSYTTSLPQRVYQADGYASNGYMYVFGGRGTATTCTSNTYIAPISANTTIAAGNDPSGIGDWSQTNVKYNGTRYGNAVAFDQGRAYVFGGGCNGAFVASVDRGYYTTMQAQPAVAKYSRAIDTDTDVFPTKWLMNGLDNDVGARWQARYRSSTSAAGAWGQETNYGTVTLGTPAAYLPLNSSGTNTNFARYYYFNISIDSSKAFGYPDDISRGPTIKDISLFFTSDPSKRLRHGATFTGGQLQPLDTPFP